MSRLATQPEVSVTRAARPRSKDRPRRAAKRGKRRADSKELALACGYILGRHFFGLDDLHYGYWQQGVPLDLAHLGEAQENFTEFLISQIPAGATSILDVGCGTGTVAESLIGLGHRVDCVSPSVYLTPVARKRLGDKANFYECRFEEVDTETRYDVVLFCESFQYVEMGEALRRARDHAQARRSPRDRGFLPHRD